MGKKYRNRQITPENEQGEATYVREEIEVADEQPAAEVVAEPAAPVEEIVEEPKVDFDGWYGARASKIPGHHHKEILKADFKGRKMPVMATMAEFDAALKKYGVSLA